MKISAKGRYALAAAIEMAQSCPPGAYTALVSISERLGISKIYLEQVFSLLKRGGVVNAVKGSRGGYQLARPAKDITLLDILSAVEASLFEENDATVPETAPEIEKALTQTVYKKLDGAIETTLREITLEQLVLEAEQHKTGDGLMYYI